MTFYLCMMGTHTRLTSGRGKEAALKPCILKVVFEAWQSGTERCEGGNPSMITSNRKFFFNVHMTKTAYSCQRGVRQVSSRVRGL